MANDLATLKTRLATQLRDPSMAVWATGELGELLTDAAAQLWPRIAKPIRESVTLADDDDQYTLTTVAEVSRVDLLDEDGKLLSPLPSGTWELWVDQETVGGTLYINPHFASTGRTLRVHGYAPYDLVTSLPPNRIVPLIQAMARSEALRRMVGSRARYAEWMALNQKENVTVNELTIMLNEADGEVARLRSEMKTWRRPTSAR